MRTAGARSIGKWLLAALLTAACAAGCADNRPTDVGPDLDLEGIWSFVGQVGFAGQVYQQSSGTAQATQDGELLVIHAVGDYHSPDGGVSGPLDYTFSCLAEGSRITVIPFTMEIVDPRGRTVQCRVTGDGTATPTRIEIAGVVTFTGGLADYTVVLTR